MDQSTIMEIAGFIIICLLTIIGFFTKQLVTAVKNLESAVNELRVCVGIHQTKIEDFGKSCAERHGVIDKRLHDHGSRINGIERNIEVIKAKQ